MSNTTNAAFYSLPVDIVDQMDAERRAEARKFYWAYPGERWRYSFEAEWLRERGYEAAALLAASLAQMCGEYPEFAAALSAAECVADVTGQS